MIERIHHFNSEVLGVNREQPDLLSKSEYLWLIEALEEEIEEFVEAYTKQDLVGCVDSVLDLAYFAVGACKRMGLTVDQTEKCFAVIHNANMLKKIGIKATRTNDGSVADAVKPEGWIAPEQVMEMIIYAKK